MALYKNILLALDLTDQSEAVGERAVAIANNFDAKLTLLHVVEYVPVDPSGEALLPTPVDLEEELLDSARKRLDALADRLGIKGCRRRVELGAIKSQIVRVIEDMDADLLILGSHERHGLELLLGSTGRSIFSAAPCDVLAVRLP